MKRRRTVHTDEPSGNRVLPGGGPMRTKDAPNAPFQGFSWPLMGTVLAFMLLQAGCQSDSDTLFREVPASKSGLSFTNTLVEAPELNILNYLYYYNGAGVAVADFNADGLPDIYLVSNQGADALYLNQGQLRFREVTSEAGIDNSGGWTTGVTHADINGDGLEDLYICKPGGYRALRGRNLLYINQGVDASGIPRFEEQAAAYNLDYESLSTQAAFFDYDLDGDLDAFLLNHSVHPNRNYGRGSQRMGYDPLAGDLLLRNDEGYFTDVSEQAGIYQGKAGYGLGLGISDLNLDGYPDIYVGNDFFENDYLYLNQGDGTFQEVISGPDPLIGHTSHYSMGNDIADLNNDGYPDILSLDMLPEDLVTYKTSGLEYAYPIYRQYLKQGFAPQYMQNTLQLNLGDGRFSEVGFLSGIASTEWSWGGLLADFDNDGHTDIFVSNGIKGATNDMDYMNFIANEDIQRRIDAGMEQTDMPLTREIPEKKVGNYMFKNTGNLDFENVSEEWLPTGPTFSQGCAYADLDGDGDLDLLISHTDQAVSLLENTSDNSRSLMLEFRGEGANSRGIGVRATAFSGGKQLTRELYPTRGYLSALPSSLHFGLGNAEQVDSLFVHWPGGATQKQYNLPAGSRLTLREAEALPGPAFSPGKAAQPPLKATDAEREWEVLQVAGIAAHRENPTLDFDREPLVPYAMSNEGPALATGDFNGDGRDDFFICGAKHQASALYLQQENGVFLSAFEAAFEPAAVNEDTAVLIRDVNGDGQPDLIVASGGNEFTSGQPLTPRLYLNQGGQPVLMEQAFQDIQLNASGIGARDLDGDGDTDLLLTADAVPGTFGETPRHYLLSNDGQGLFTDATLSLAPALRDLGPVSDLQWADLDSDGTEELILAGHWEPLRVLKWDSGLWQPWNIEVLLDNPGLWNTVRAQDVDGDGDLDLLAGNWGKNTRLRASQEYPLKLLRSDFDSNGKEEALVTYFHHGVETPFASRDELVKQMPYLRKAFPTYSRFARASLSELFGPEALEAARTKEVTELASCLFRNEGGGRFTKIVLPPIAQASAVYDFLVDDLNGDGLPDILPLGNLYQISTQLGRLDALQGMVLIAQADGGYTWDPRFTAPISGAARDWGSLEINGRKTFIIARNDAAPVFLAKRIN